MGSDYRVLVLPPNGQTGPELSRTSRIKNHGAWIEVLGAEWKSDAQELSTRFQTSAVWWSMQTPMDRLWMFAFHQGKEMRELRFSAEAKGWAANRGEGLPFEDTLALAEWLKKWLKKKSPLVARDGADVLDAFIGKNLSKAKAKPKPKPRKKPAAKKKKRPAARKRRA